MTKPNTPEIQRCLDEQIHCAALLLAGHPEQHGLRMAIEDWVMEEVLIMAEKKSLLSVSKTHDENNLRTALEVLSNPDLWGGEGSGMVDWAHRVVDRLQPKAQAETQNVAPSGDISTEL